MNLGRLRAKRRDLYIREMFPYWRYVVSSGGLVFGFALILAIHGYMTLLTDIRQSGTAPASLLPAAAAVVALCLLWNPARTYLLQPDLVFLTPLEGKLNDYFLGAWKSGAFISGALTALALLLYWPLYNAAEPGRAAVYGIACGCVLALKALLYYGSWKEKQFRYVGDRLAFLGVKSVAALATCVALLQSDWSWTYVLLPLLWLAYAFALRFPDAYRIHWEHLLQLERRTVSLHESWFGLFADLPTRVETYKPRPYFRPLLRLVNYRRENAFLYMHWRTFLRSPLLPMALRWIALGMALIWMFPETWSAVAIYVLFCWVLLLQLQTIQSAPSDPLLAVIAPLPSSLQDRSRRVILKTVAAVGVVVMGLPLFVVVPFPLAAACAVLSAGAAIWAGRKEKAP